MKTELADYLNAEADKTKAAQFPTVQEQIDYWNTKERLEHERVMNIRSESPNESIETGDGLSIYGDKWTGQMRNGFYVFRDRDGNLYESSQIIHAKSVASNPKTVASTTAEPSTKEEGLTLDQTEATCDYLDEQERKWSLREAGSNDGEGESYSARNV